MIGYTNTDDVIFIDRECPTECQNVVKDQTVTTTLGSVMDDVNVPMELMKIQFFAQSVSCSSTFFVKYKKLVMHLIPLE